MNDPIVETLEYCLKLSNEISFDNPPTIEEELQDFKLKLADGLLQIQMKIFFSTELEARTIVEPFLKAWELDNFMKRGHKDLCFEFICSKIVDRNPPTLTKSEVLIAEVGEFFILGHEVGFHVTRKSYPPIPQNLLYTPDVESLANRYEGFLNGREPLLSMAYFCLSLLQFTSGGRIMAANKYNIDKDVLDMLGTLTSEHGDKSEARKLDETSKMKPLTELEQTWIRETIKLIIRRKAEYDFDNYAIFTQINFKSLPPIKDLKSFAD
jgi:hypothetical protein